MRQLRLVHLTDDGTTLLLERADGGGDTGPGEQFHLPVDAVLRHAVRTERPRPEPALPELPRPEPGATISPRDIQMRVRAGESPDALAAASGDSPDKIMRFAAPVVQERARIADEARRGRARRTTTDGTIVSFGETVDRRFAAHGIDPADVTWDAYRPHGDWLVVARWIGGLDGEDEHGAEWMFHRASRTVTPVDDTAIDLLSDRPIRPVAPPEPEPPAPPRLAPGVFVFPPMPEAATGPVLRIEDVFDQEATDRAEPDEPAPAELSNAGLSTAGLSTAELSTTELTTAEPGYDEPPLPLGTWSPASETADADAGAEHAIAEKIRRTKNGRGRHSAATRTKVPSWDDILLGVRRESD